MALTASKYEAAAVIGIHVDTVDKLLLVGHLKRLKDIWTVRVTYESLAEYMGVSIEHIAHACSSVPPKPTTKAKGRPKKQLVQVEMLVPSEPKITRKKLKRPTQLELWPLDAPPVSRKQPKAFKRQIWPGAFPRDAKISRDCRPWSPEI